MTIEEILAKVDTGAAARAAEEIGNKAAFDVLVVGGGTAAAGDDRDLHAGVAQHLDSDNFV